MKELISRIAAEHNADKNDLLRIISSRNPEYDEFLFETADRIRRSIYGTEKYQITVKTTVFTAAYAAETKMLKDTALMKMKYLNAVMKATDSDSGRLSCRAERIVSLLMK